MFQFSMSANPPKPEGGLEAIMNSSNKLLEFQENIFKELKGTELLCTKCDQYGTFKLKGRGGTAAKLTLTKKIQITCTNCNMDTILGLILTANDKHRDPENRAWIIKNNAEMKRLMENHMTLATGIQNKLQGERVSEAKRTKTGPMDKFRIRLAVEPKEREENQRKFTAPPSSANSEPPKINELKHVTMKNDDPYVRELEKEVEELKRENKQLKDIVLNFQKENLETRARIDKLEMIVMNNMGSMARGRSGSKGRKEIPGHKPVNRRSSRTPSRPIRKRSNSTHQPRTTAWTEVVKKGITRAFNGRSKNKIRQEMKKSFGEQHEPVEFERIRFLVSNSLALKKCPRNEKRAWTRRALKFLTIERDAFDFSTIGNNVIEIYVPESASESVRVKLRERNIEIITQIKGYEGQNPENAKRATISRLAVAYGRATLRKLRACILRGHSQEITEAVIAKELTYRKSIEEAEFNVEPLGGKNGGLSSKRKYDENGEETHLRDTEMMVVSNNESIAPTGAASQC